MRISGGRSVMMALCQNFGVCQNFQKCSLKTNLKSICVRLDEMNLCALYEYFKICYYFMLLYGLKFQTLAHYISGLDYFD